MPNIPVSDDHHLVHLHDLLIEEINGLQVALFADLGDGVEEDAVVGLREGDAREEIRDDAAEERDVVRQELWKVDVHD